MMLRKQAHFAPELILIVAGQVAIVMAGMVSVRVFTARMGPETYGELNLGLTLAALLNPVLLGPLVQTYLRLFAPYVERRRLGVLVRSLKPIIFSVTGLLGLGSVAAVVGIGHFWSARWGLLVAFSLLYVLALGFSSLCEAFQIAARQRAVVAAHQALNNWVRIPLVLMCLAWLGNGGQFALLGYVLTGALILLSQFYFLQRLVRSATVDEERPVDQFLHEQTREIYQQVWKFGSPFVLLSVFSWLQLYSDRWIIELTTNTAAVGLYAALVQLAGTPIVLMGSSAAQFAQPIAFARGGDASDPARLRRAHEFMNRFTLIFAALILTGVAGLWVFGGAILRLFTAPAFWSSAYLLPSIGLVAGINALAQLQTVVGFVHNRSKDYLLIYGVAGLFGTLLSFSLGRSLGLSGIVWGGLIAATVRLIWISWLSHRLNLTASLLREITPA
jgi:O-antigen/teichoic acid export membrane protein